MMTNYTIALSNNQDPDKIVSVLSIAVVTLLILLVLNIYKVRKLKTKLKSIADNDK